MLDAALATNGSLSENKGDGRFFSTKREYCRMPNALETVKNVAAAIEEEVSEHPFLIVNESELQAYLQQGLLQSFREEPELKLDKDVIDRRLGHEKRCRRVYREAKIRPGRSAEPDIVVLGNTHQVMLGKANRAPSRFQAPHALIIETKMDVSPEDVLAGKRGNPLSESTLRKDVEKWSTPSEAQDVISLVYTAQPERYEHCDNTIVIKRALPESDAKAASVKATLNACQAYEEAEIAMFEIFKKEPFRFLREKDFETFLFKRMREAVSVEPDELHPVHTQWWSAWENLLGRRRRHDLVVLTTNKQKLALEVEIKTSHSDQHNWFVKKELRGEFDAMHRLVEHGKLDCAVFLMYRFGPLRWEDSAEAVCEQFPNVSLSYRCSD